MDTRLKDTYFNPNSPDGFRASRVAHDIRFHGGAYSGGLRLHL